MCTNALKCRAMRVAGPFAIAVVALSLTQSIRGSQDAGRCDKFRLYLPSSPPGARGREGGKEGRRGWYVWLSSWV